jgi:hypothetical protein
VICPEEELSAVEARPCVPQSSRASAAASLVAWSLNQISSAPSAAARPRDGENAADEWRAYRDLDDELPVFCPECAEREFGD